MKNKLIYKSTAFLTFLLPIATYLILSATILSINPNYIISTKEEVLIEDNFVYTLDKNVEYVGLVKYNEELETFGIYLEEGQIAKIGREYLSHELVENEFKIVKLNPFQVSKKSGWQIPVTVFFILIGGFIAGLVVYGKYKFKLVRKHTKISVFVSLLIGTGVLYVIDMMVHSIFMVFLIITASFGAFIVETYLHNNSNKEVKAANKKNEMLDMLSSILDGY